MKKFYKLLFVLIITFVFIPYIYASNPCEGQTFNNKSEEYTCYYENGIKTDYPGCNIYNKEYENVFKTIGSLSSKLYSNGVKATMLWDDKIVIRKIDENIPVTTAWSVIRNDGNAVYAGCYTGYLKKIKDNGVLTQTVDYDVVASNDGSSDIIGVVYYIKVLEPDSNGKCNTKPTGNYNGDLFVPAGYQVQYYNTFDFKARTVNTDENPVSNGYGYSGYVPTKTSGCPLNFNLTENYPKWWNASLKNRYIFTNDNIPTYKVSWLRSVFSSEKNIAVTGTISEEKSGYEETKQCYTDVANKEIPKYSCSEISSFSDKLKPYQTECKSERKTHYMRDFDEKNQSEFLQIIGDATSKKIEECYLEKCGITSTSAVIQKLSQSKYSNCSNGCTSLKVENTLNTTSEAQSSSSSCSSCYSTFYNDMASQGLITEAQKTCLLNNLNEQIQTINSELGDIKSDFVDTVNNDAENSQKTRNETAKATYAKFTPPEMSGGVFGRGGSCSQILGSNGVKILKGVITTIRILAPIVALINAMIILLPAVTSKDADALKKASSKCVKLAVVLAIVEIFPSVIKLIGALFGWDTCGI